MQARYYAPAIGRFYSPDPIGYQDQLNLYAYVGNDPVNGADPDGRRCVSANASSVYCARRDKYNIFDAQVGGKTRFFAAAAATVEYLANNDLPLFGNVISDDAEAFLRNVSSSLYSLNARVFAAISNGSISGTGLDRKLVHMEQTRVQLMLDALPSAQRAAIVTSINEAFNGDMRGASGLFSSSDSRYNRVLNSVVEALGRPIDFGNQRDREAIGNALVDSIRASTPTLSNQDCIKAGITCGGGADFWQ